MGGETVRRVTEAVGAVAEAAQQEDIGRARRDVLTRPAGGAVDIVLAVDGCQVLLLDGWHEMKVGRVAPLGPATRTDHRTGRTYLAWGDAAICAGLEGAEDFWYRVVVTAWRGGLGRQTRRVVVLGDGAEWIWIRAAQFVGGPGITVVEILDLFHAYEHLWEAGRAVFDAPDALAAWAEPLKDALYEEAADVLRRARAYFTDNAARMDDPRYVAQQLPIGSGAVEFVQDADRGAREGGRDALDAAGGAGGGHAARRARLGRLGGFLGHPPAADALAAVPSGAPTPTGERDSTRPGRG